MNAFTRMLYALLIAVAVVLFVGVSINSVYPGPKAPEYPTMTHSSTGPEDKEAQKQQQNFDKQYKEHRAKEKNYQRNVSFIAVALSVLIVPFGLWYMRRNEIIGEGVALGGVAVSLYALIMALAGDHRIARLLAVTALLISAILLVHRRFIEKPPVKKRR